jgi:NAD(P)-dependent dehydrogenase (short-subunit alcohol dehydrogenase family)
MSKHMVHYMDFRQTTITRTRAMRFDQLTPKALFNVAGLTAAVTGGASGLGLAFAQVLADNGARVHLLDVDGEAIEAAVSALAERGGEAKGTAVDVTNPAALTAAISGASAETGRLDIVFSNAGITAGPGFMTTDRKRDPQGAIENVPEALWNKVMATNLTSVFSTIRASVPIMQRHKSGSIIVTTSIAGLRPSPVVGTPYMISKAAAAHLVKQTAFELAAHGIRVNAIAPGPFLTRITSPGLKEIWEKALPIGRVAVTDEIKGLALFLASPASAFVTGHQFVIDGGSSLGRAA